MLDEERDSKNGITLTPIPIDDLSRRPNLIPTGVTPITEEADEVDVPRWDEITDASTNVTMYSDTDATDELHIGHPSTRWTDLNAYASEQMTLVATGATSIGSIILDGDGELGWVVDINAEGSEIDGMRLRSDNAIYIEADGQAGIDSINEELLLAGELDVILESRAGDVTITAAVVLRLEGTTQVIIDGNGHTALFAIPTSNSGLANGELFTQTAAQLGGTGTTKVICIV